MDRRHIVITNLIECLSKMHDEIDAKRYKDRKNWELYTEKIKELMLIKERMMKQLMLNDKDERPIAFYFEGTLVVEQRHLDNNQDIDRLRIWLEFMNEETEKVMI
jgi:hypothetical protein